MWKWGKTVGIAAVFAIAVAVILRKNESLTLQLGSSSSAWNKDAALQLFTHWSDRLGIWAFPLYVSFHTLTIALCLPYAVFLEAAASLLFGFFPALLCVFSAKLLGASLSFFLGRLVFRRSTSAMEWAQRNKYFHLLSRGVEQDGWRFVLLARFSPIPSYVINYALAATRVGFLVDFLLPTVIGCLPMILQNTSLGSLAGAAVASTSGSRKSQVWSYLFPLLGVGSSVLISLKIKKYSMGIAAIESSPSNLTRKCNDDDSPENVSRRNESEDVKRNQQKEG